MGLDPSGTSFLTIRLMILRDYLICGSEMRILCGQILDQQGGSLCASGRLVSSCLDDGLWVSWRVQHRGTEAQRHRVSSGIVPSPRLWRASIERRSRNEYSTDACVGVSLEGFLDRINKIYKIKSADSIPRSPFPHKSCAPRNYGDAPDALTFGPCSRII